MGIEEGTAELHRVLEGVVSPECGAALVPGGGTGDPRTLRCGSCGRSVLWYPGERRLEYGVAFPQGEREKYDRWAARQASREFGYEPGRSVDPDDWFDRSASMAELAAAWPEARDLAGRRILDVGGSCKDSWRFLGMGARRVDQLDVSPASQRLGLARLEAALAGVDVDWRERIVFHTVRPRLSPSRRTPSTSSSRGRRSTTSTVPAPSRRSPASCVRGASWSSSSRASRGSSTRRCARGGACSVWTGAPTTPCGPERSGGWRGCSVR